MPKHQTRTVLSDVPESQMINSRHLTSRFKIVDQSKLDFAISMLRVQSEAGIGVNLSGPAAFIRMAEGFRVFDDILNIPIHYVYRGKPLGGVFQQYQSFDGPVIDWNEFGLEPIDPIDQIYIDLCDGVAPKSNGYVEVVDGVCNSLRFRENYIDDLRSIEGIGLHYSNNPLLFFVVHLPAISDLFGQVFSFMASVFVKDLKVDSLTEFSHACVSCPVSKISFLYRRDKDFFRENVKNSRIDSSTIRFVLSLNPHGEMQNLNTRDRSITAAPIDYTCMSLEDGKVSFNYGAGVIDGDMQSILMPSQLMAYADRFYGRMSACPATVDKVSLYLPRRV